MTGNNEADIGWCTLRQMVWQQRTRLVFVLLLAALAAASALLPYWVIFQAVNALLSLSNGLDSRLYQLAGWMAVALVLKTILYALAYFLSHQAAYSILAETRQSLVAQIARAPLNWLQERSSGELKQSILQDVEYVETFLSHHTVEVFAALVSPSLIMVYLFWTDWRLALAALFTAPLAVLASALFMRGSGKQYDTYNHAAAALNGAVLEYVRNMPVMKVFRQDVNNFQSLRQSLEKYYSLTSELTKRTVPGWALFSSLLSANVLFILPVGIWLYTNGIVTFLQVIMAVVLGSGMLKPLLKVSRFFMEINEVLAGIRRLAPILALVPPSHNFQKINGDSITVEFCGLSFSYHDKIVLKDINLLLKPGSFTVLVGTSGAGKSTMAQLLGGLLVPDVGSVSVNGEPVTELNNVQRSTLVALASQDAFLFKGSIMENICLARPQASQAQVQAAVKVAQAEALINALPQGYETQIHEQGIRLSGGEKQRIAISRALLADTPVLVLDEATASLDNITQQALFRAIKEQYPDKTILVIAHRSYGIENADQIVVLEHGHIQDVGSHQDLLLRNSFYQRLWQRQTDNEYWALETKLNEGVENNAPTKVADESK